MNWKKLEIVKVIVFDEKALKKIQGSGLVFSMLSFLIFCIVLAFPTEKFSFNIYSKNFLIILLIILSTELMTFAIIKAVNHRIKPINFFSINAALMIMSLIVLVPAGILSYIISLTFLKTSVLTLVFSLVPFYHFVFFGWFNEEISCLKGFKGILIALASMIIYFSANYLIGMLTQ